MVHGSLQITIFLMPTHIAAFSVVEYMLGAPKKGVHVILQGCH